LTLEIYYNNSAFKHGIIMADIENAVSSFIFDNAIEGEDSKYLLIGFDTKGNLLKIIYNVINDNSINVFHAMKCRKDFYKLFER